MHVRARPQGPDAGERRALDAAGERGLSATAECAAVLESAKEMGLLLGKGGLRGQTIRFAPPMCINSADADFLLRVFASTRADELALTAWTPQQRDAFILREISGVETINLIYINT